ncbi:MAG TPA: aspartyl protease family protein [Steroidobacteraceae bacterium]|nr:aspartyl protease family protein [Steroidobacteraceae bacterium]
MTRTNLLTAIFALPLAASSAFAHPVAQTTEAVLHANQEAMGDFPKAGTLRVQYVAEVNGLKGTATYTIDLATGMFIDELDAYPLSGTGGFDGKTPWMRDISGSAITQEGGDRVTVAVNEAYRDANLWWRADRGGAQVSYVGREKAGSHELDHLAVTPQRGSRFDAWFDADSHLLVRTAEPQMFFKTQELYGDYRRIGKIMVAGSRQVDFGNGESNIQKMTAPSVTHEAARPASAYARPTARAPGGELVDGAVTDTIPFRLLNNHVYIEARVNGKGPYTFIVDTGGHTLLSPRVIKEAGLESVGATETSGSGEKTETSGFARYREIAVGKARLRDQVGFAIEIYDPSVEGIRVDGMIGFEYFSRFAVRLDYGTLTMTTTDFAHFDAKDAGQAVPFKFYDHLPQVTGAIDGVPAVFDIDTGSRSEIDVTGPTVARHKLRDKYVKGVSAITGWGVGGPSRSYVARLPSLTLHGIETPDVVAGLSEAKGGSFSDPSYDGNIGSGFLKRFAVTFDYSHQTMYLDRIKPTPVDAGRFDRSGMWINAVNDAYEIKSIAASSPAAAAGLAEGDLITSLNGQPAVAATLSDARMMLRDLPAGTQVAVTYKRGGSEQHATLKLRDQI